MFGNNHRLRQKKVSSGITRPSSNVFSDGCNKSPKDVGRLEPGSKSGTILVGKQLGRGITKQGKFWREPWETVKWVWFGSDCYVDMHWSVSVCSSDVPMATPTTPMMRWVIFKPSLPDNTMAMAQQSMPTVISPIHPLVTPPRVPCQMAAAIASQTSNSS
jgi:hypothetical protein